MTGGTRAFFWAAAALWVLLCAVAWGPLRIPSPTLAVGFALLAVVVLPGVLLARLFGLPERGPLSALPVGFLLGLGLWSVPAVVTTTYVHGSLENVAWFVAIVIAALIVGALLLESRRPLPAPAGSAPIPPDHSVATLIFWVAAVATVFAMTYLVAWRGEPLSGADRLSYLAFTRHFLESDAIFTRGFILGPDTQLNARQFFQPWLVILALVVRVARVDLLDAYTLLLPLFLVPLACLGLLLFARELFGDRRAGLLALPAQALVLLSVYSNSFAFGFFGRLIEDKFLLRYALLPVALWLALRFLRTGRRGYLAALAAGAVGIVLVHPLGIVFLGIALGPFLLLSLLLARAPGHAGRALWLLALLALLLPIPLWERWLVAAAAANATHLTFSLESGLSGPLSSIRENRLLLFPDGGYVVSPSLVSAPLLLLALALTPLLLPALRRLESARFLFASTAAVLLVCFSPLTPLFGVVMTPWMLWRVLWLVPAPLLIVFFLRWPFTARGGSGGRPSFARLFAPLGILLAAGLLFAGDIANTLEEMDRDRAKRLPPADMRAVLRHLNDTAAPGSIILTPSSQFDQELPGFVSQAYSLSFRWLGAPGINQEREALYASGRLGVRGLEFFKRQRISLVVAQAGTQFATACRVLPRQLAEEYSNGSYSVFEWRATPLTPVDRSALEGQSLLESGDHAGAAAAFSAVLAAEASNGTALLGLADLLEKVGRPAEALPLIQRLLEMMPHDPWLLIKSGDLLAAAASPATQANTEELLERYRVAALAAPDSRVVHDDILSSLRRVRAWPPATSPAVQSLSEALLPHFRERVERQPGQVRFQQQLVEAYRLLRMDAEAAAVESRIAVAGGGRRRITVSEWLQPRFNRVVTRLWGRQAAGRGDQKTW